MECYKVEVLRLDRGWQSTVVNVAPNPGGRICDTPGRAVEQAFFVAGVLEEEPRTVGENLRALLAINLLLRMWPMMESSADLVDLIQRAQENIPDSVVAVQEAAQ